MCPRVPLSPIHPWLAARPSTSSAGHLLSRASLITRLLLRSGDSGLSRAEIAVLSSVERDGAQRITEIASSQALAQPTVTQLVATMEARGLVERARDPQDGRVVLVSLTPEGFAALQAFRNHYRSVLRAQLSERSDEEIQALASATELMQDVIDALRGQVA